MDDIRYPEQDLDYQPTGRWRPQQLLKGMLDGYNHDAEIGHLLD
jgi:hypothetical protein